MLFFVHVQIKYYYQKGRLLIECYYVMLWFILTFFILLDVSSKRFMERWRPNQQITEFQTVGLRFKDLHVRKWYLDHAKFDVGTMPSKFPSVSLRVPKRRSHPLRGGWKIVIACFRIVLRDESQTVRSNPLRCCSLTSNPINQIAKLFMNFDWNFF